MGRRPFGSHFTSYPFSKWERREMGTISLRNFLPFKKLLFSKICLLKVWCMTGLVLLQVPRLIFNFWDFSLSYSSFKTTPQHPGHRGVANPRCPRCQGAKNLKCPGHQEVKTPGILFWLQANLPSLGIPGSREWTVSGIPGSWESLISRTSGVVF